jgi:hypothetical protein
MPKRAATYVLKSFALIAERDGREIARDHVQAYNAEAALTHALDKSSEHKIDPFDESVNWRAEELNATRT